MRFAKVLFILLVSMAMAFVCLAQTEDYNPYQYTRPESGNQTSYSNLNNVLSFGFGIGGYYPYNGVYYQENPGVILSYDHTILKHAGPGIVSLGAVVSYKQIYSPYMDYTTGYTYTQNWDYYIVGARAIYCLTSFPGNIIEPYAGAMLAYYITNFKLTSTDPNYSEPGDPGYYLFTSDYKNFFAPGIFAGIRSRFNKRESFWIEVGYGYTSMAFGMSYKF